MPQVINTNVMSLNAQRNLNRSQMSMSTSLQRLSSGLRINTAKDDAAGMAIAERFTSQIRGLGQAQRNANDAISLVQTAEGALNEVVSNLQRMRELSIQLANGALSSSDRESLSLETQQLALEINRVSNATDFNGVAVIGAGASISFQIGANANAANNELIVSTKDVAGTSGAISALAFSGMSSQVSARNSISAIDSSIDNINKIRSNFGAQQNRLESMVRNMANISENMSASRSRIMDADFAVETANLTRTQILQQAGTAMLAQANTVPQNVMSLLQ